MICEIPVLLRTCPIPLCHTYTVPVNLRSVHAAIDCGRVRMFKKKLNSVDITFSLAPFKPANHDNKKILQHWQKRTYQQYLNTGNNRTWHSNFNIISVLWIQIHYICIRNSGSWYYPQWPISWTGSWNLHRLFTQEQYSYLSICGRRKNLKLLILARLFSFKNILKQTILNE